MPIDHHIIPRKTNDAGTAHSLADLHRRLKRLESGFGVIGGGAVITGAAFETAITGARIIMQGPLSSSLPGAGEGIFVINSANQTAISITAGFGIILSQSNGGGMFVADGSGGVAIAIQPGIGITMETGPAEINQIVWKLPHGGAATGSVWSQQFFTGASLTLINAIAPDSSSAQLEVECGSGGVGALGFTCPGGNATICDQNGRGIWSSSIGYFGKSPPFFQPAPPRTDTLAHLGADVTAILQTYGFTF